MNECHRLAYDNKQFMTFSHSVAFNRKYGCQQISLYAHKAYNIQPHIQPTTFNV